MAVVEGWEGPKGGKPGPQNPIWRPVHLNEAAPPAPAPEEFYTSALMGPSSVRSGDTSRHASETHMIRFGQSGRFWRTSPADRSGGSSQSEGAETRQHAPRCDVTLETNWSLSRDFFFLVIFWLFFFSQSTKTEP